MKYIYIMIIFNSPSIKKNIIGLTALLLTSTSYAHNIYSNLSINTSEIGLYAGGRFYLKYPTEDKKSAHSMNVELGIGSSFDMINSNTYFKFHNHLGNDTMDKYFNNDSFGKSVKAEFEKKNPDLTEDDQLHDKVKNLVSFDKNDRFSFIPKINIGYQYELAVWGNAKHTVNINCGLQINALTVIRNIATILTNYNLIEFLTELQNAKQDIVFNKTYKFEHYRENIEHDRINTSNAYFHTETGSGMTIFEYNSLDDDKKRKYSREITTDKESYIRKNNITNIRAKTNNKKTSFYERFPDYQTDEEKKKSLDATIKSLDYKINYVPYYLYIDKGLRRAFSIFVGVEHDWKLPVQSLHLNTKFRVHFHPTTLINSL
ncbi:MAG: hypothetical protein AAFO15_01595, partial [Pseudomonadota bacterium]